MTRWKEKLTFHNSLVPVFKGRPRKRKKHEPPSNSKKAKIMQPSLLKKVEVHEEKTNPKMSASVLTKKNHHKDLMGIKPKQIRGKDTVTKKSIENDEVIYLLEILFSHTP